MDIKNILFKEPKLPTEVESDNDNGITMKCKCTSSGGPPDLQYSPPPILYYVPDSQCQLGTLKHLKAYSTLEDVHLTLWNKPSGLNKNWHRVVTRSSKPPSNCQHTLGLVSLQLLHPKLLPSFPLWSLIIHHHSRLCPPPPPPLARHAHCHSTEILSHSLMRMPRAVVITN